MNHKRIEHNLLAVSTLTCNRAIKLAQSIKASEREVKQLCGDYHSTSLLSAEKKSDLNFMQRGHCSNSTSILCYYCGDPHLAPQCKHKKLFVISVK